MESITSFLAFVVTATPNLSPGMSLIYSLLTTALVLLNNVVAFIAIYVYKHRQYSIREVADDWPSSTLISAVVAGTWVFMTLSVQALFSLSLGVAFVITSGVALVLIIMGVIARLLRKVEGPDSTIEQQQP